MERRSREDGGASEVGGQSHEPRFGNGPLTRTSEVRNQKSEAGRKAEKLKFLYVLGVHRMSLEGARSRIRDFAQRTPRESFGKGLFLTSGL
jgi:hypothetical protein